MTNDVLAQGGWELEVHRRLCELIDGVREDRRVAVFDFDNTCILGDIGELYGHFLVETMRYRYDLDAFWELIHPADGRKQLRRWTEQALQIDAERRADTAAYRRYLAEMAGLYGRRLQRAGKRDCYEWAVRLHVGLTERQMKSWSSQAIERELKMERRVDEFETEEGQRVRIERGVRPFAEVRNLISTLHRHDWEVWIVSATNKWTVREFAPCFGVDPRRVLGNRVAVEGHRLTARTERPVLFRQGKVEAIERTIGSEPALVVGDAITDYEMLCEASELAVVVDCGDERLQRESGARGWAMQPQQKLTPETLRG